jgi:hypothetical protein
VEVNGFVVCVLLLLDATHRADRISLSSVVVRFFIFIFMLFLFYSFFMPV